MQQPNKFAAIFIIFMDQFFIHIFYGWSGDCRAPNSHTLPNFESYSLR